MPTYDYKCATCGRGREVILRLSELDSLVKCLHCQSEMNRQVSAPRIVTDYPGYVSPVTGRWVEGRAAHREDLAVSGCRILEPGEREAYEQASRRRDLDLDRKVDGSVEEFIATTTPEKRDALASAIEHGLDAAVVRQTPTGE